MVTKRRKKRKPYPSTPFLIFLGFLFLSLAALLVFSNFKINQRRSKLISNIENLKREIQILEKKTAELRAGISQTSKESYWEATIREQGLVREGESQVVILPSEEEAKGEEEINFWNPQGWLDWFKRKITQ